MKFGTGHNEKRDFSRMPVNAELTYNIPGDNQTYTGVCNDLSHTGIFFITEQSLSNGQTLEVTIDSRDSKFEPMKATVEVIRVESSYNKFSIGCKILEFQ